MVQAGFHALTIGHCVLEFDEDGRATMLNGQNELLLAVVYFGILHSTTDQGVFETACDFIHGQPNVVVCKNTLRRKDFNGQYIPRVRALQSQVIANVENKNATFVYLMNLAVANSLPRWRIHSAQFKSTWT